MMDAHLLTWIIFTPLIGVLMLLVMPRGQDQSLRIVAMLAAVADFVISLQLVRGFTPTASMQFEEIVPWVPDLGLTYRLGVDGISLWLVMLTTLLGPLVILSTWSAVKERVREFMVSLLLLQTAMVGAFCALDLALFYIFFEAMLIPMALIIGIWGGERRVYAAFKFVLYTAVGSVLMLVGILYLYNKAGGSFALADVARVPLSVAEQAWLFGAFALAFAIKVPLFPLHTWLPDAHVEAPTAGSVVLASVLLKMGTYGLLRFAIPLFPLAVDRYSPLLALLAVIGIIYGALVALVQKDVKKLVAYSSVSHLGFVVLGLFAMTPEAISGGIYIMLAHGLSTGMLFLLVGVVYERRHTRLISDFGGLAHGMPRYATFFMLASLASVGLPGMANFVGEFLVLVGSYKSGLLAHARLWTVLAGTGVVLGAIYMLWVVQRMFFGECDKEENRSLKDMSLRESLVLIPLVILALWMGIYPKPWLSTMEPAVEKVVAEHQRALAAAGEADDADVAFTDGAEEDR